jgi:methyl-accepting chemotaxis protein
MKNMKGMKEEISKDRAILKNIQSETNSQIAEIKTSIESLVNGVEQVENTVSETEDKAEELVQTIKDHKKC